MTIPAPKQLFTVVCSDSRHPGTIHTTPCKDWGDCVVEVEENDDQRYPLLWVYSDDGKTVTRITRADMLAEVEKSAERARAERRSDAGLKNWFEGQLL